MLDNKKTRTIISIIFIAASLLFTIVGIFVLPETVAMQIAANGEKSNLMPKPIGLIIPFALILLFTIWFYGGEKKSLLGMCAGIIVYVFMFVVNLL